MGQEEFVGPKPLQTMVTKETKCFMHKMGPKHKKIESSQKKKLEQMQGRRV